jgi:hypothetical protein
MAAVTCMPRTNENLPATGPTAIAEGEARLLLLLLSLLALLLLSMTPSSPPERVTAAWTALCLVLGVRKKLLPKVSICIGT